MAWTKVRTLLKNHCRLQSNITQECPMVPTVKNMVRYVTRKAPTRSNNQDSQKKSESIKPQVKWKSGWNNHFAIFTYKNLKIHIQRQQHNCHTLNLYSFPLKVIGKLEKLYEHHMYL